MFLGKPRNARQGKPPYPSAYGAKKEAADKVGKGGRAVNHAANIAREGRYANRLDRPAGVLVGRRCL